MSDQIVIQKGSELFSKFTRVFGAFEKIQVNKFGLTVPQSYTLITIHHNKIITMTQLAGSLRVTQTTMTRVVDNLVRDGYIERIRSEEDRRVVEVQLTETGIDIVNKIKALYLEATGLSFAKISRNMWEQINTCLSVLLSAMEEVEKEL